MRVLCSVSGWSLGLVAAVTLLPGPAHAGSFPYFGLSFGTPDRAAARVGVAFGQSIPSGGGEVEIGASPIVEAGIGMGAGQIGLGRSLLILTDEKHLRVLSDVRATLTRTWGSARGASPRSTYTGVDGGLSISFVRFTVGVSKRIERRSSGANFLFGWSVGAQIALGSKRHKG
jgi:hypothetical protein